MTDIDQIVEALTALGRQLTDDVHNAAVRLAADPGNHDLVVALVKLKVDIEAVEFAATVCAQRRSTEPN